MKNLRTYLRLAVLACGFHGADASAEDISGTITFTKTIFEDSQLVGDVTCTMTDSPCIDFGASHIKLWLNGFTITGPRSPDTPPDPTNPALSCNATSGSPVADGIRIMNQTDAHILGPGMVQRFRRHGILIVGTIGVPTKATVKHIVSHHNCFSGLVTNGMSDSDIEEVVSVRNANNSGAARARPPVAAIASSTATTTAFEGIISPATVPLPAATTISVSVSSPVAAAT
jgi:hypothetical protein